jgi:hypothetical protein
LPGAAGTTFDGIAVNGEAVVVKYTLLGDSNLDGAVNFGDYSNLQNHYGQTGAGIGWIDGDFNYDGSVTFQDYSLLQNNYGKVTE